MPGRRHRVIAFGELLMRLEPRDHQRIVQAGEFQVRYTGGEANAAALLASLGVDAACSEGGGLLCVAECLQPLTQRAAPGHRLRIVTR